MGLSWVRVRVMELSWDCHGLGLGSWDFIGYIHKVMGAVRWRATSIACSEG